MTAPAPTRARLPVFLGLGLLVTLVLAGLVSGFADRDPDGLEKVAQDKGFADTAQPHPLAGSPLADYGVRGVDDERASVGLAGVIGVGITFTLGVGVFALVKRRRPTDPSSP